MTDISDKIWMHDPNYNNLPKGENMNETALTDRQMKILEAAEEYDKMLSKLMSSESGPDALQFQGELKVLEDKIHLAIYAPDKVDLFQPIEIPIPQGYRIKPGAIVPLVKCDE